MNFHKTFIAQTRIAIERVCSIYEVIVRLEKVSYMLANAHFAMVCNL